MADLKEAPQTFEPLETIESVETRVVRYAEHPITFEEFLDYSFATGHDVELINGVLVERTPDMSKLAEEVTSVKMSTQLTHEKLLIWLITVTNGYVRRRNLGLVLGSRTPVEISDFRGRMPDLLFVRQERLAIVQERAIHGAPDLVIELVSPNDRPSDLSAVEADYRALGVPEIVFINMPRQHVRVVRNGETECIEETLTTGTWQSNVVPGLALQVAWLLTEPRPDELDTLQALLGDM